MLNGIKDALVSLEARMDRRFEQVDRRFEQVDARFVQIDARFVQMEARFSQVDRRFEALDTKMSRHFVWLVGLLISGLVAMLGVLGAITAAILGGR